MSWLEAIVLGIVQGLTEFLPISSSAHLVIVPWLFNWDEPGVAFDAALHLGTLLAVLVYFHRDLIGMLLAAPRALTAPMHLLRAPAGSLTREDRNGRLALLLIIGSIPGGIAGLLLQDTIDSVFHTGGNETRAIAAISIVMMLFGLVLWLVERRASHRREIGEVAPADALTVGIAQALALFPGVSRSGITLTAGLLRGLKRADAARFSFLLGTPLVLLAGGKGALDIVQEGSAGIGTGILLLGIAASAISGFAAIWGLLRFLQRSSTLVFTIYRLAVGAVILIAIAAGFR